ncbi:hypothetical protein SAMN05421743_101376 [Thalassobacillus cyri]|uniref:DUF2178 domain-containing protein n=1 Tax=Thalassobacillus cyri TaxID=571932 RepID=A0A1H3WC22_9BACI|nr:hypothetical protein [Thalassobacillus cyri]SDZ83892.1 hypothetical protein SAMN05421743_101376 [Thalassobacillus cyri]
MNYLSLIVTIFVLLFALRKISRIKYSKSHSAIKEAKQNVISLLWGVLVIAAMIFIPYKVWMLTGSSPYWDGFYIVGGTALLTITVSFIFYYKSSVKLS